MVNITIIYSEQEFRSIGLFA